jgi:inosine-uridine nucleoside N-ribohydrolase
MNSNSKSNAQTRREFLSGSAGLLLAGSAGHLSIPANARTSHSYSSTAPVAPDKPHRIIIDTDPGVDDALAILLALHSPELQVEALTPVSGNVPLELTLPNALRLLEIAGRTDVPVAAGAATPLVRRLITASYVHGQNGLAGVDFPEPKIKPVPESANELIRRLVRNNPGEISIVAIGPLTNVAMALKTDPELAHMIRSIVIMGGSLSGGNVTPSAEFNFYVDPEAARIVFDSAVPLTMVGLDVTRKVVMRPEHVVALEAAKNPSSQAAGKIVRRILENKHGNLENGVMAMHDPCTVAHLIDPAILTLTDHYVTIETSGEFTAGESLGYTHAPTRKSAPMEAATNPAAPAAEDPFRPNAKVATAVDPDRFFRLFIPRLTGAAS